MCSHFFHMFKIMKSKLTGISKSTDKAENINIKEFVKPMSMSHDDLQHNIEGKGNPLQKAEIERLNLSNLTANQSDLESDRTITPRDMQQQQQPVIGSVRNDQTVSQFSARVPFQNYENEEPVTDATLPHGKWPEQGARLFETKLLLHSDSNADRQAVHSLGHNSYTSQGNTVFQNQSDISKLTLMTPADFLSKRGTGVVETGVNRDSNLTPRTLSTVASTAVSECTSIASTPRVLCQNSDHNHPLSETRSFRVTDFKEQITPRSTSSVTPREQLSSLGFESNSTQLVQKEIVTIRNRLKSYDEKKKKLRKMQKQLKQLSDWLRCMEVKGQDTEDVDVINAKQEVQELTSDVEVLRGSVEKEKSQCASLVERVKVLTAQLTS